MAEDLVTPSNPRITVLLSVYNGERWLRDAMNSVLNQSLTDFELVIVNDGSTDRSSVIANEYAALDPRIRVIHKENTGLAHSLNVGFAAARGEWTARLDADDVCSSERLATQYAFARTNPALVYIGSNCCLLDEDGDLLARYAYPTTSRRLKKHLVRGGRFPPHSSAFFRTDAVRAIGAYRVRISKAEDHDLWLRLSHFGEFGCVQRDLVCIRQHSGQITAQKAGYETKLDSVIAVTSYWLRQMGNTDPVSGGELQFTRFQQWVAGRFEAARIMEEFGLISDVRSACSGNLSPTQMRSLFFAVTRDWALTSSVLRKRILGDSLGRSLASAWSANEMS